MRILYAYDQWCLAKLETFLVWLEEWFSIPQKTVERALIVIYLAIFVLPPSNHARSATFICAFCLGYMMWILHQRPQAVRFLTRRNKTSAILRLSFQFWCGFVVFRCLLSLFHRLDDITNAILVIDYLIFFYMIDLNSEGTPGRRRKLALAELKKLFGTEWIPEPAPIPQSN